MRAVFALILAVAAYSQPRPAPGVQFEVVSIKPGDPADPGSSVYTTRTRLIMGDTTLSDLVRSAYHLNEYQLEGGPKWMRTARFSIEAKLPAGAPRGQISAMMQAMLADRFKLEFHRATKTRPEYELVVGKGGPKIQPAAEGEHGAAGQGPRRINGRGLPVSALASMLISAVGAPVIDKTGLEGKYDFSLEFAPLISTPGQDDALPSIFMALQEQLGLKLEKTKGPLEILVVDRAEMPSPN